MNEDDLVARLKSLENNAPRVRVDRARVLRAGRRRRGARAAGISVVAVAAVLGAYSAVGALPVHGDASRPADTPASQTPTPSARAHVDPVTGVADLPMDDRVMNEVDVAVMESAQSLAMSRCMADAGFGNAYRFVEPKKPDARPGYRYGVWDVASLRQRGYSGPTTDIFDSSTDIDLSAPGASGAMSDCLQDVKALGLVGGPEGVKATAPVGRKTAEDLPAGQAVLADWRDCLRTHDVDPPTDRSSFTPTFPSDPSLGEQVRVGLIDIACKKEVDLNQRMSDIELASQQAYLVRARHYLAAWDAYFTPILARDRAYLAEAGYQVEGG